MPTLFANLTLALWLVIPQHAIQDGVAAHRDKVIVVGQTSEYPLNGAGTTFTAPMPSEVWIESGAGHPVTDENMALWSRVHEDSANLASYRPQGGIVVSVDAEAVFEQSLAQSWSCVNERLGRRQVHGKMFSKVDYEIKPSASLDGALLQIYMEGVSFGESTATRSEKKQIVVDALTSFKSRQMLLLRSTGVEYGPLDLTVQAAQKFNRTTSSNPFAATLAKRVLKKPSAGLKAKTNAFAKKQIERNVAQHLAMTYRRGVDSITRMFHQLPLLEQFSWSISSDDRFIYAVADNYEMPALVNDPFGVGGPGQAAWPVMITLSSDVATNLVNQHLANKQIGSLGLEAQYDSLSKFLHLPKLEVKNDQYWTIDFGQLPGSIQFHEDRIEIELKADRIASDKQSISNMMVGFSLRPVHKNGYWYLVRDDGVSVRHVDDNGGRLGARQLAFRTVMSKRLDRVVPEYVALKRSAGKTNYQDPLDLELSLDKIQPSLGQLTFGFKTK